MRDLLLVCILLGVLPWALRHTYAAVLLWTWVSIMNPHKMAFGFAYTFPFAAIAAGAAMISMIFTKDRLKLPKNPAVITLVLFVLWMCLTTAFAFNPDPSFEQLKKILKIQLMTLVAMAALQERRHIELFVWINALSIGFYGLKGGLFTIKSGGSGTVWGPGGGFIEGNNELAVALIVTIPLINFLRSGTTSQWLRHSLLGLMIMSAIAALGTQSRGAFLAISAMGLVLWFRTDKKLLSGIGVSIVAIALIAFMPESWERRMSTIKTYEDDSSAMGRINAWWLTVNIANDRFLGGGFEIYTPELFARYAPNPIDLHVAHSIYFSVLGEHGYVGLFLFLMIWWMAFRTAGQIRKDSRKRLQTHWSFHLASMCQVSLVGYAVGGAFLSLAYFDLPYNILVILLVTQRWLAEKRWESDTKGAFASKELVKSPPPPTLGVTQR